MIRLAERAVLLSLAAVLLGACQNDYPLEPTPCDEFCYATERAACQHPDPASCVATCEAEELIEVPRGPECRGLWEAMLSCHRALPEAALCLGRGPSGAGEPALDCSAELIAYRECSRALE